MASINFTTAISILLMSILLVSSSDNYGYGLTSNTVEPTPTYSSTPVKPITQYSPKFDTITPTKPQVDNYKPNYESDYKPNDEAKSTNNYVSSSPKLDYIQDSKPDIVKPEPTYSSTPKPVKLDSDYNQKPNTKQTSETKPKVDNYKPNYGSNNKAYNNQPKSENVKPKKKYATEQKPKPSNDKSDYGSYNKPDYVQPKPTTTKPSFTYDPEQKPKPSSDKPSYDYDSKPNHDQPKDSTPKPENDYLTKVDITIPKIDNIKPNLDQPELPVPKQNTDKLDYANNPVPNTLLQTGIEGLVMCKSGSKYSPIEGAVIKIICSVVDNIDNKLTPLTYLTEATNLKGFFFKVLPLLGDNLKITECKAFLESSPLETCKTPTDVNHGISGALLSSFNILHDKKVKLFSVGPFFYTSEKTQPTPIGGY